ncbi:NUDIX domain-containing protein [Paenibacillus sp. GYB006]|uniref:NUDIX domain-containing protein n=1 Tax=Paenibacillus sp. GYB006 TaxID=2994394 RepID=UPI002F96D090
MEVRQMSTAFLFNENKVIMMKKEASKITDTVFWTGLGGHLEANELNFPKKACVREIFEESGIQEEEIEELKLRYILLRVKEEEIRQQFVYFGKTKRLKFINSDEGELHWIDRDKILDMRLSKIISFMMKHYLENPNKNEIMVGTITINKDEDPEMQWSELKDPKIF